MSAEAAKKAKALTALESELQYAIDHIDAMEATVQNFNNSPEGDNPRAQDDWTDSM